MAAPTVTPAAAAPKIGFTGAAIAGTVRESQDIVLTADDEPVRAEDNNVSHHIFSNPAAERSANATVLATGFAQPLIGATATLGSLTGIVTESRVSEGRTLSRFACRILKENTVIYS